MPRKVFTVATVVPAPGAEGHGAVHASRLDRKRLARARRVTLPFAAVAPGTTRVRLTTRAAGRTVTLGTGSRTRAEVGTVRLAVRLDACRAGGCSSVPRGCECGSPRASRPTDGPATPHDRPLHHRLTTGRGRSRAPAAPSYGFVVLSVNVSVLL